ncbi:helix-turn-helix transcriptional regulator [Speluncibacter jeojiensis]|uniref:MarR family transcriptional regulator n=1 Tax=Speluncibacter jeojiensis TaxID=2710754 RepID=A0A9X4M476_9ACTN|nr:helix-turn-helix domain-containing protein [Rhodococcus sp. D2-41]MDG3016499.1 MarR family transcriptional regulator [Corynebacteriales bacterium D3-21]
MVNRPSEPGPRPALPPQDRPHLSGQRAQVLDHLRRKDVPVLVADLAAELGVHTNTAREHLEALVQLDVVSKTRAPSSGRGRPAWLYRATDRAEPDVRVRDYAGLATALAGHIQRTSSHPADDALAAGREWGRELAVALPAVPGATDPAAAPNAAVMELLRGLGFAPEPDAACTTAALRRCPLLDAAERYPDVVCKVHLGIVRGALEVFGGTADRTDLIPFAEPGACRLVLSAADPGHG